MPYKEKAKEIASFLSPDDEDENISVLESVCDLVEAGSPCIGCQAARPEPRHRINTRTIAWAALVAALFLPPLIPLDEFIGAAAAFRGPAIGLHEVRVVSSVVKMGQPLIVNVKSEYLKVCMWRWVLEWSRASDGFPIASNWTPGAAHIISRVVEHEMALELPKGISPGNYILNSSGTGECDHGDKAQIINPTLAFTVTD